MFRMNIRSCFKDYHLEFTDDFLKCLGGIYTGKSHIIVDRNVYQLYRERFFELSIGSEFIVIDAEESVKSFEGAKALIDALMDRGVQKNHQLIAIGGGTIQDVTAFAASMLFRGVDWVFFPTTVLAQADSCIGSKTSVNYGSYKNLLGTFYPPSHIFIDLFFLNTLRREAIQSGIGEILHYYFVDGRPEAVSLMEHYESVLNKPVLLTEHIQNSLVIKKNVIEMDEFDKGARNIFNYGHTFGHAVESVTNYRIGHGQAVTVGMDLANYLSLWQKMIDQDKFDWMHKLLKKNLPEFQFNNSNMDSYFKALSKDKKNTGSDLTCILLSDYGAAEKKTLPLNEQLKSQILAYSESFCFVS